MTMQQEANPIAQPRDGKHRDENVVEYDLHQALEQIIGSTEAATLRRVKGVKDLVCELELRCGEQAGRGVAFRVGSAFFTLMVRRLGDKAGFTLPAFRLLPLRLRLLQGLLALRGLLSDFGGRGVRVEEQDGKLFWRIQDCPICIGRRATSPICFLMLGILKEAMSWLSGGKAFDVHEIACRGRGDDDCIFLIDPLPMDQ